MPSPFHEPSEETVKIVAEAIYDQQVRSAREAAEKFNLQLDRIESCLDQAREEADRSSAILLFALAEDLMLSCLKHNMNNNVAGGWKTITEGTGVLSSASNRLTILELLNWISPATAGDLRLMKSIRNRFAHHADVRSFDDEKVAGWVSSMRHSEAPALELYPDSSDWRKFRQRELFLMRSGLAISQLVVELAVGPAAVRHGVAPLDVVGTSFDGSSDATKAARRIGAKNLLHFMPPR